jgi:hypothetical protein
MGMTRTASTAPNRYHMTSVAQVRILSLSRFFLGHSSRTSRGSPDLIWPIMILLIIDGYCLYQYKVESPCLFIFVATDLIWKLTLGLHEYTFLMLILIISVLRVVRRLHVLRYE